LINELVIILGVIVSWYLLYELNGAIFQYFDTNEFVSWVFLPAILRLVCVLLFGVTGVIGLFLGCFVTSLSLTNDLLNSTLISFASSLSPLIAIKVCKQVMKIPTDLSNLSAKHLLVMTFIAAVTSSGIHSLYFWYANNPIYFGQMFIGDLIGSLLALYALRYFLSRLLFAKDSKMD
jgi:hypothetical protein